MSWIPFMIHKRFTKVGFLLLTIDYQIYEVQSRILFRDFTNNITRFHDDFEIIDPHFSIVFDTCIILV